MGHSTYGTTADIYTHLFKGDDQAVSARLDAAFLGTQPSPRTVVPFPTANDG